MLFILLLIGFASSLSFTTDSLIMIHSGSTVSIPLHCEGGVGKIQFRVKGLPQGLTLKNGVIEGLLDSKNGSFPVRVDAKDTNGNSISQIIVIKIEDKQNLNSNTSLQNSVDSSQQNSTSSSSRVIIIKKQDNNKKLDSLLNSLAPPSTSSNYKFRTIDHQKSLQQQTYPVLNAPLGVPSNIPENSLPKLISSSNAKVSQSPQNQITPTNIKTAAIFERQINANKAIANLLNIIDQLRANANSAKNKIPLFDKTLKKSMKQQQFHQNNILQIQNQRQRLYKAITNLQSSLKQLKDQHSSLNKEYSQHSHTITTKQKQTEKLKNRLQQAINKLSQTLNQIQLQKHKVTNYNNAISSIEEKIKKFTIQLEDQQKKIVNIDDRIDRANLSVRRIDVQILDLMRRLQDAKTRREQAEKQQNKLRQLKINVMPIIVTTKDKIFTAELSITNLTKQRNLVYPLISQLENKAAQQKENNQNLQKQLNKILTDIQSFTNTGQNVNVLIRGKGREIQEGVNNLVFLKGKTDEIQNSLRNAYNKGNQANAKVARARQNLNLIVKRWEQSSVELKEANYNLQKARAEKQLADLVMEELLQQRSSALPYSIVPNGNGVTSGGTPSGNNPRGSPLGTLTINNPSNLPNPYQKQTQSLTDYTHYLSSTYKQGIDPTNSKTVTKNYPFTIYHQPKLQSQSIIIPISGQQNKYWQNTFKCNKQNAIALSGQIKQIGQNTILVKKQKEQYIVRIAPCSEGKANIPGYSMQIGDTITFLGSKAGNKIYNLYEATCTCRYC